MKPIIAFLSGLSGTGKTALVEYFRERPIDGWLICDFDEGGKPVPALRDDHHAWRIEQSERWLKQAIVETQAGKKLAVFGLSLWPSAMRALSSARMVGLENIHFALLHADNAVRKDRIMKRNASDAWQGEQDWHIQLYKEMRAINSPIFDTTDVNLEETAKAVCLWLLQC